MTDTAYYLNDATVRKNYDALDRQTLDCGQQCKDTFDALCAAVAQVAEARGRQQVAREWARVIFERDALRETVARLTVADTDALTALILATDEVARRGNDDG
jgi:hypothetical protein